VAAWSVTQAFCLFTKEQAGKTARLVTLEA